MKPAFWKPSRTALAVAFLVAGSPERKAPKSMSYRGQAKHGNDVIVHTGITKSSCATAWVELMSAIVPCVAYA